MIAFIDDHRVTYGVEPICKVLPIAPDGHAPWGSISSRSSTKTLLAGLFFGR